MRLVDLINNLFEIIEQYPDYIFHLDAQTIVLEDYLKIYPENKEKLEKYIKEGNILVGPWYLQNDFYLTSGEATIRNLLIGTRIADSFGCCSTAGYAPDQFGNISQLPQILRNFGIDNFIFGRGYNPHAYNEKGEKYLVPVPPEFIWRGADGSEVLAVHMRYWYNNAQRFSADIEKAEALVKAIEASFEDICATPYLLLMNGVDHLEAQDDLLPILDKLNKCDINGEIKQIKMSDYIESFKNYVKENKISLSYFNGELRHGWDSSILQGTLSSRHYLKVQNVKTQNLIENRIEPLYSMLGITGFDQIYPYNYMRYMWKSLLENHPHDSICGCSRDEVHRHMEDRFACVNEVGNELLVKALDIASYHNAVAIGDTCAYSMVVVNTLSTEMGGTVEAIVRFPQSEQVNNFKITDSKGDLVDFAVISKNKEILDVFSSINLPGKIDVDAYKIYMYVDAVKPMSFAGYKIEKQDGEVKFCNQSEKDDAVLENDNIRVEINKTGTVNIYDKNSGRKLENCIWFEDTADIGDAYIFGPAGDNAISSNTVTPEIEIVENNEYRSACTVKWSMLLPEKYDTEKQSRSSQTAVTEITLKLSLKKGDKFLNVDYSVDNKSSNHRLRMHVRSDVNNNIFFADIPYDIVCHRDGDSNPNIVDDVHPNTSFAAISNGRNVTAVFTEGAHECAKFGDDTLAFTLVRSTGAIDRYCGAQWQCPENQCLREISGRCAIT